MGKPTGMRAFMIVWAGQVASLLGTAMAQFALTIWAYEMTGSATALALVAFFNFAPVMIFGPVAGALVDRWNRKLVMMLSDLAAGIATVGIFLLYVSGNLQIWHLYAAGVVMGLFGTFQWPAYSAAISTMLPKAQYARANGLLSLAESVSGVFAPVFATALLALIGIGGVMLIDIITCVIAIGALLIVHIPQPEMTEAGSEGKGSLLHESLYGFRYIVRRPSLLGLQMTFFFSNLMAAFGITLRAPMLLARTGSDEAVLAAVQSLTALGSVGGGVLLSVTGGPKRKVYGVLLSMMGVSLFGDVLMGLGQTVIVWGIAGLVAGLIMPFINGSNQAIWQAKVAPDLQGRVFGARRMIAQFTTPIAMLIAGPLADRVFEPAMQVGGSLAPTFGGLVGTGPGAGMALMTVIFGTLGVLVGLGGFAVRVIRNAEELLPDHGADASAAQTA